MQDFLGAYPGEYALPMDRAGFPAWVQWQHFFNGFLMVLIIRTGCRCAAEAAALLDARWSKNGKRKISSRCGSTSPWTSCGSSTASCSWCCCSRPASWMRIVPTSWEVFPNALSAALQYVSLDWPTENGWVNYNSLQQLAYFTTVFIAAPLADVTGVRMSGSGRRTPPALNRLYPVEWARAIHFPVMLYFVAFIVVHVTLVLATGALRNLNHMYGGTDGVSWVGFWLFVGSTLLIVVAWVAARPLVLAPIARLSGKVTRAANW